MSEYSKGRKAWLDNECSFTEADSRNPEFSSGYTTASKLYPNRRPKIIVRSKIQIRKDRSRVTCKSCGAKFEIDDLLLDAEFCATKQCPSCHVEIPIVIGDQRKNE